MKNLVCVCKYLFSCVGFFYFHRLSLKSLIIYLIWNGATWIFYSFVCLTFVAQTNSSENEIIQNAKHIKKRVNVCNQCSFAAKANPRKPLSTDAKQRLTMVLLKLTPWENRCQPTQSGDRQYFFGGVIVPLLSSQTDTIYIVFIINDFTARRKLRWSLWK